MLSREWRCSWSIADRRCSNYIWVIDNFIAYKGAAYIRDFTVSHYNYAQDLHMKVKVLTHRRLKIKRFTTANHVTTKTRHRIKLSIRCMPIIYHKISRALSQYKVFPRYGDSHVKDKTVVRLSYLFHGDPYNGKTTSLYCDGPQN